MELAQLEALAFHPDKRAALSSLLPGTKEGDYYRAVALQNEGRLDEAEAIIASFKKRYGYDGAEMRERLKKRQLLLRAATNLPEVASDLARELNVTFEDRAEIVAEAQRFPASLDPALVDGPRLLEAELQRTHDLSTVTDYALPELIGRIPASDIGRRRALLSRLDGRANFPGLIEEVAADLLDRSSPVAFGAHRIHGQLTLAQLEELAQRCPEIQKGAAWVDAVLKRLRPPSFVDIRVDGEDKRAFLDRLWAFVAPLAPSMNTLKAHVLYHMLEHDRRRGYYDRAKFLAYLDLPRNSPWVAREWASSQRAEHLVSLSSPAGRAAGLEPIADDLPLVRDYLLNFLLVEDGSAFTHRVRAEWIDELLATTRLLAGATGVDAERWAKVLGQERLTALRDRVDIELTPLNRLVYGESERVTLDVALKNVRELEIKVFRINTIAYWLSKGAEVDTSIDLDGMVAKGQERRLSFKDEPAIRLTRHRIDLPECDRPGTYIIELIGNGRSSRALIKKGSLRHSVRIGAAGPVVTIMNERGEPQKDVKIWIGGRELSPPPSANNEALGSVTVPFSTRPGRIPILLCHGDITQREWLSHPAEEVELRAGFHVERESLVPNRSAQILLRPTLRIGGAEAPLALVEDPSVEVQVEAGDGSVSTKTEAVALRDDSETVVSLTVPDGAVSITARLRGRVRVMSTQTTVDVEDVTSGTMNRIHRSEATTTIHLAKVAPPPGAPPHAMRHILYVLGKTGEPIASRAVPLSLHHRYLSRAIDTTCETDETGAIDLGLLTGVSEVTAQLGETSRTFELGAFFGAPHLVHAAHGETITLPRPIDVELRDLSLVEVRGGCPLLDMTSACAISDRCVVIRGGALPPGDYQLSLRGHATPVHIVVAPRSPRRDWSMAGRAMFEISPPLPLIRDFSLSPDKTEAVLRVTGATPYTRVHVVAARFRAESILTSSSIASAAKAPLSSRNDPAFSLYISGRDIGDEYRYVLDRRAAARRPGTMLDKPSLLLNPWALRTTSTGVQHAAVGAAYQSVAAPAAMAMPAPAARPSRARELSSGKGGRRAVASDPGYPTCDFLQSGAVVLPNLRVDAEGFVRIPLADLGVSADGSEAPQILDATLIDPMITASVELALPLLPRVAARDLRLRLALDPTKHYAEDRSVAAVRAGTSIVIDDVRTGKLELVDTLARAHQILLTLTDMADLRELSFVKDWHTLDPTTRRARYSKYASHELNIFLWQKDRAFFDEVVRPYLAHKRDKTFVDQFLLEGDLTTWIEPWRFAKLNTVERILLGLRVAEVKDAIARLVGDQVDILPADPERDARLVATLLGSSALEPSEVMIAAEAAMADEGFAAPEELDEEAPDTAANWHASRIADEQPKAKMAKMRAPPPPPAPMAAGPGGGGFGGAAMMDLLERERAEPMFRGADKTKELAETSWYKRRIEEIDSELVPPNRFWRDLANHTRSATPGAPFLSPHLGDCTTSLAEVMCALAFLDLPFVAGRHETKLEDMTLTVVPATHVLAARTRLLEVRTAPVTEEPRTTNVLVGQNYLRSDDRYVWVSSERREKYIPPNGEMLRGVVYRGQVVVTNLTSAREKLDVLLQIPRGAIAVATTSDSNGFITKTVNIELGPYGTQALEYAFYFPRAGRFTHFPAHVCKGLDLVAFVTAPQEITVVDQPTVVDTTSWAHVSQRGSLDEVIALLERENLARVDLGRVAWRMHERAAFERITATLASRCHFDDALWRYALLHQDRRRLAEWLQCRDDFLNDVGPVLDRTRAIVGVDAVDRGTYQHLEYAPLINARAHRLGADQKILNDALASQYRAFLDRVAHRPHATNDDLLVATHYLLAMDRIDDALTSLARVSPDASGAFARLQYAYLAAYSACYRGDLKAARSLASPHRDHPVDRWRNLFTALLSMLDEVEGAAAPDARATERRLIDPDSRDQQMAASAARQPTLDVSMVGSDVILDHHAVTDCEIRFYKMDIELLFSRQPFVQGDIDRFSFIEPTITVNVPLTTEGRTSLALPTELRGANIVIEVVAPSIRRSIAHYAHDLTVHVAHAFGQVHVIQASTREPLRATYVKVYGRYHDRSVHFFKDGYTDLRGRFDYATLSTDDLDRVERLSLLIASDQAGATIVEASPPPR